VTGQAPSKWPQNMGPKTLPCSGCSPASLAAANHDHRNCGRLSDGRADRSKKHTGEPPAATATDYDKLGTFGFLNQPPGRLIAEDESLDMHIRVLFVPAGETLGLEAVEAMLLESGGSMFRCRTDP
jgi:hypothetical protein